MGKSANERKRLHAQWRREERERLKVKVKNKYGNADKTTYSAITGNDISLSATTWNQQTLNRLVEKYKKREGKEENLPEYMRELKAIEDRYLPAGYKDLPEPRRLSKTEAS